MNLGRAETLRYVVIEMRQIIAKKYQNFVLFMAFFATSLFRGSRSRIKTERKTREQNLTSRYFCKLFSSNTVITFGLETLQTDSVAFRQ